MDRANAGSGRGRTQTMKRALLAAVLVATLSAAGPALADLESALRDYEAGNFEAAYAEFKNLADGGEAVAMFHLGLMHENGEGTSLNYPRAADWYRRAAQRGNGDAQLRLGMLYEQGLGVPLDLPRAAQYFRDAAEQGVVAAQTRLGLAYRDGRGVLPDPAEARRWLDKAAATGDDEALQAVLDMDRAAQPENRDLVGVVPGLPPGADNSDQELGPELSLPAQQLRERLRSALQKAAPPGSALSYGALAITEESGRFLVRLDDVALTMRDAGRRFEIGTLRAVFTSVAPDLYRVTMTLPQLVTVHDAEGRESGRVAIGRQAFDGQWSSAELAFDTLDIAYHEVAFDLDNGAVSGRIGTFAYQSALTARGQGRVSGPATVILEDVRVVGENGASMASIAKASLATEVRDFNRAYFDDLNSRAALMGGVYEESEGQSPLSALPRDLGELLGAGSVDIELEGLTFRDTAAGGEVMLGSLSYGFAIADVDRSLATLSAHYAHDALDLRGPDVPSDLVPRQIAIRLGVDRIPLNQLVDLAGVMVQQSFVAEPGANPPEMDIAAALAAAKTVLRVDEASVAAGEAEAALNGTLQADAAAMTGAVGSFLLTTVGIDWLVGKLNAMTDDEDARQMAATLTVLQAMGRPEQDSSGRTVSVYDIQLDTQGRMLVNGNDMQPLMGMME